MIAGRPASILRQLETPGVPDGELLARFVRARDQAAFAELVRRYGSVVLGVGQRVTGHRQDAEDVFQAVFLVLAQKAHCIEKPGLLGNWLYGVAVRVAQKARRAVSRRRARETAVSVMPEPAVAPPSMTADLGPVLDEELSALSAGYRDAIVHCDLRGVPRAEAATTLGVPEGTLSSRLAMGRKKLAERLTRRGVALSAAAIPTTLAVTQAAVAVPNTLHAGECRLVADFLAGTPLPRPLLKLAEGGLTVRKTLMLVLASSAALAAGVVCATQPGQEAPANKPPTAVAAAKQEAKDEPKAAEQPAQDAFTTKPRLQRTIDLAGGNVSQFLWNPQGNRYAVIFGDGSSCRASIYSLDSQKETQVSRDSPWRFIGFAPDGKTVVLERREYKLVSGLHELQFLKLTVDNNYVVERTVNLGPEETQGYAFSPDGKTFRTVAVQRDPTTRNIQKLTV